MSTIYQGRLGRLRVRQESSYGTDMSGSLGSWDDVPANMDSIEVERLEEIVQPGHLIQRLDQRDLGVPMPREAKVGFSTNLETVTTVGGSGTAPAQHWLGVMLECGFGGKRISTGTTIATTSTSSSLNVTSASTYRAGGAVAMVNASGLLEIREIKSISSNNIVLKMAFSFTPANAAVVYGVATYFLHNNPLGADPTYLQLALEGYNPKDRWIFPGGALSSFGFSGLEPKGIPRIKWGWQHPTWLPADGSSTAANLRSAALAQVAYTHTNLSTVRAADYRLRTLSGSTIPSFLNAPKVEITPNVEYEALETPGGGSGLAANTNCFGYRRVEQYEKSAVDVSLDVHWENDTTLDDYHANATPLGLLCQIGVSQSKGGCLISVPRLQISKPPGEILLGGVRGKSLTLYALHDTEATSAGASTDDDALAQAAFRMHFTGPTA